MYGLTDEEKRLREAYEYDAFGRQTVISDGDDPGIEVNFTANDGRVVGGSSRLVTSGTTVVVANPFLFTGQRLDPETKLYYYKNRYYSTDLGRFIHRDPIASELNLYRYVGNGPTNATDASGLQPKQTLAQWKKQAQNLLTAWPPETLEHAIENNKNISAFYASVYQSDPEAFYWFGMGAYASYGVGLGLNRLYVRKRILGFKIIDLGVPKVQVFGNEASDVFAVLSAGNHAIFLEMAWVALAYQGGGMKELEQHKASIDPVLYQGWVELDKAIQEKGAIKKLELATAGTKKLVEREQTVLQGILDQVDKKFLRQMTPTLMTAKPVFPGGEWGFGDFGDLQYRIKQANDPILRNFLVHQHEYKEKVKKFMGDRVAGKLP